MCLGAGLTKVPIDGQPRSIVRELEDMARTYIKVCAIFAVRANSIWGLMQVGS